MTQHILWLWLSLSTSLFASHSFFLPDEADDALYHLEDLIDSAQKHLLIIPPEMDRTLWEKPLALAADRGIAITLITDAEMPQGGEALIRFKRVDYRNVEGLQSAERNGRLGLTIFIVDGTEACSSTLPLSRAHFEHDLGMLECSSALEPLARFSTYARRILARSKAYLQP